MAPRWRSYGKQSGKGRTGARRSKRSKSSRSKNTANFTRIDFLRVMFSIMGVVIVGRLFVVQVVDASYYKALATKKQSLVRDLSPERGDILVQDPYTDTGTATIATNKELSEVHAVPLRISDPAGTAAALSPLLNIPEEDLLVKLDKPEDPDELLKRRVPQEVVDAIDELELEGIDFRQEQWRFYPEGEYTAHLTGYFGYSDEDKRGQYGAEGFFNEELTGEAGRLEGEKDGFGRFLSIGDNYIQNANDGVDLELTIDKNVQFYVYDRLKESVEKHGAKSGSVIIMHPDTGAIIAMANYPSYDPNRYNEVESVEVFSNLSLQEYEPGSVFKAFTLAGGMDLGLINPSTTYVDTGELKTDEYTIRNSDKKAYGTQTMTDVLSKSLNTGTGYVARLMGNKRFYEYVQAFGFGEITDIELAGEYDGNIDELSKLSDVYTVTGSYGQGLTTTPMQLIAAYTALANGGNLLKPYIIENKTLANGETITTEPEVVRQVISADTSRLISAMLVNVIDDGHAGLAGVDGYLLAGKTGTAQVVTSNGTYDANQHNDTFVGYGPISDPQFVMLTKLDQPTNAPWASATAAPLFGEIANYLVQYYQIPPDTQ